MANLTMIVASGQTLLKIVMKDFAGKFGTLFFIWFGYKIDAPSLQKGHYGCGFSKGPFKGSGPCPLDGPIKIIQQAGSSAFERSLWKVHP